MRKKNPDMPFEPAEELSPVEVQNEEPKKEIDDSKEYMSGQDFASTRGLNGKNKTERKLSHSLNSSSQILN